MPTLAERITIDPQQRGGHPCIRGTRIRVVAILDHLTNGLTPEEVLAAMPDLELDDIRAGLRYASRQAQHLID